MSDPNRPGDVPPDLPPDYAEAYRRGYERAYRESVGDETTLEHEPSTPRRSPTSGRAPAPRPPAVARTAPSPVRP